MNRLSLEKRTQIINLLVEGSSMRATSRIVDVSINTVTKLLIDVGLACMEYQDKHLRNLKCERIQCDEIWSFCYAKVKNLPPEKKGVLGFGDTWTYTSICPDTKLIPCWRVGRRDFPTTLAFMQDLASRFDHKIQLTTDGFYSYIEATERAFGIDVDYGMLVSNYDETKPMPKLKPNQRFVSENKTAMIGDPNLRHISTSICERQNLTMRMNMKRFTRRTNAYSKKIENHAHMVALYFMHYNFARIHQTLKVTPAMEAGVTDRIWSLQEVVKLSN